jgi:capsule polysaccharide modification protein KpsS
MAHTEFVEVYRVEHGDYMFIPKQVQEKYQDKFVLKEEEEVVEEIIKEYEEEAVEEVKPKRGRRAK